jgi:spore germination protein YaaH
LKYYKKLFPVFTLILVFTLNFAFVSAKPSWNTPSPSTNQASLTYSEITSNEITLNWQSVSKATNYKVYRSTSNDSNYTLIATVSTTSYKDTNLEPNSNYWYFVSAYNRKGTLSDSTHTSITTKPLLPTTPPIISTKQVLGFTTYYYTGDPSSYNSMVANTSTIDDIATHTFIVDGEGNISGLVPYNQITFGNENGLNTLAMLSNNFDGNIAKILLESPSNRQALINNISTALKNNGYKGINIDLEGVFYYDRDYLTTFMSELYARFKNEGFYVTMSVPAKTSDSPTNSWNGAYDYSALANYTDQIVLMTYDEHYPGGSPGAIASIGWVENVIKFATSVIPKEKILLGTAAYGYDWSSTGTKAYSINGIYNLASSYNAAIKWDSTSQCPYFTYVDSSNINHTVWFENAESLNYKLDLVNSYDIAGIGIWRLGLENPDYWTSIKTKFNR